MSRLRTDRHTDGNVKVEQYSAEAESAIEIKQKLAVILEEARDSSEVIITWAARILSAVRLPSY